MAGTDPVDTMPAPATTGPQAMDTTRPTLLSSSPSDGATAFAGSIVLRFSEQVRSLVEADVMLVPSADLAVSYDDSTHEATITATLQPGILYTLDLLPSIKDIAGNSLDALRFSFWTADAPALTLSTGGTTTHRAPLLAFDSAGNGVALWHALGHGAMIALFDKASVTWSEPRLLVASSSTSTPSFEMTLAASDTTFVLAVADTGVVKSAVFAKPVGAWDSSAITVQTLDGAARANNTLISVQTRATDVLVAYLDATSQVKVVPASNAGVFASATTLPIAAPVTAVTTSSDGQAYVVLAQSMATASKNVWLSLSTNGGSTWRAPEALASTNTTATDLSLASGPTGFFYTFTKSSGAFGGRVLPSGSSYSPSESAVQLLTKVCSELHAARAANGYMAIALCDTTGSATIDTALCMDSDSTCASATKDTLSTPAPIAKEPLLVSAAKNILVAWKAVSGSTLHARVFKAGAWQPEDALTPYSIEAMAGDSRSTRHHIAYTRRELNGGLSLWTRFYNGTEWEAELHQDAAMDTVGAFAVSAADADTGSPGPFIKLWAEDATMKANTGGTSAGVSLLAAPTLGTAMGPAFAAANNGDACAAWVERTAFGYAGYARFIGAQGMGAATRVSTHLDAQPTMKVAASEQRCIVATYAGEASYLSVFDAGAWSPYEQAEVQPLDVLATSNAFYVLGENVDTEGNSYDIRSRRYAFSTGWEASVTLESGTGGRHTVVNAKSGDSLALAWSRTGTNVIKAATTSGVGFGSVQTVTNTGDVVNRLLVSPSPSGFMLAFTATFSAVPRVLVATSTNGVFGSPVPIDDGTESVATTALAAQATETTLFVAYPSATGIRSRTYANTAWSSATAVCDGALHKSATNGQEIRHLCLRDDDAAIDTRIATSSTSREGVALPGLTTFAFSGGDALHYALSNGVLSVQVFGDIVHPARQLGTDVEETIDASTATQRGVMFTQGSGFGKALRIVRGYAPF